MSDRDTSADLPTAGAPCQAARQHELRSACPITCALDVLGDRWTLVILRDLLLAGRRTFSELATVEGIASNVLAGRLERLERWGVVTKERDPADGRRRRYLPTARGRDLIPVLLELAIWGAEHAGGTAHHEMVAGARRDRDELVDRLIAFAEAAD